MKVVFNKYESCVDAHSNVSDVLDAEEIDQIAELESEFCEYVGCEYALATSHGTSALHLAMLALDLKRGDKVVCSVNAHPNVPEVVRHFDAEPVFIDIDEDSFNIDLNKLENYLEDNQSKKLKAVIVTHVGGACVDLDRLYKIASIYDVKVVEDACEALGAQYNGTKIGATGAEIVCFDFSPHLKKNICNGGMLATSSEEIYNRAKLLLNHAMVKNSSSLDYIYDVVDIGNEYMMSQLEAAYIRAMISKQDANIAKNQEIAQQYNKAFEGVAHITTPKNDDENHPYSLYILKIDKNRDSFAMQLKDKGIECGLHYIPLHLLSYYKSKYNLRVNDYPIALRIYQQVLSLPIYATMSEKEIAYVIESVKKVAATRV